MNKVSQLLVLDRVLERRDAAKTFGQPHEIIAWENVANVCQEWAREVLHGTKTS